MHFVCCQVEIQMVQHGDAEHGVHRTGGQRQIVRGSDDELCRVAEPVGFETPARERDQRLRNIDANHLCPTPGQQQRVLS